MPKVALDAAALPSIGSLSSYHCEVVTFLGHHLEVFTAVSWTFWAAMLSDAMVSTAPGANSITAVLLLRTDNHQGPSGAFSYWCSMAGHRAASRVSCAHAD